MSDSIIALHGSVQVTETGLIFSNGISYDEWEGLGKKLNKIEGAVQWWIGDWLVFGEQKWGEMYSQALDGTQFKYMSLAQMKRVSSSIDFCRRLQNLSWSHHQVIADLEPEDQDKLLLQADKNKWSEKDLRRKKKEYVRSKQLEDKYPNGIIPDDISLIHGDFREVLADFPKNSVDLIFTDPPYDEDTIPLYGELAKISARILKPGGSLLAYAGHYALPKYFEIMTPHLRYWWIISLQHGGGGGGNARLTGKNIFVHWKPIIWFVKDHRGINDDYVADMFLTHFQGKEFHEWQQATEEAAYYINHLTNKGDVVLDPFAGSGTTLIAAKQCGRQSIGIELDDERIKVAKGRIAGEFDGKAGII